VHLGTNLNDGRVLLTAFDKFVVRQLCILVSIHISKDLIHSLRDLGGEREYFIKAEGDQLSQEYPRQREALPSVQSFCIWRIRFAASRHR